MGAASLFIVAGAFVCFLLSARRKAPKGKPGGNDIQFSLPSALFGGLVGFACFLIAGGSQQSSPRKMPTSSIYTRDLPNTLDAVGVRGHFRDDGTYVAPHMRSREDGVFENNWSTSGNVNPYTGKAGTRRSP